MTYHFSVSHVDKKLTELDRKTNNAQFLNFKDQQRSFQTSGTNSAQ